MGAPAATCGPYSLAEGRTLRRDSMGYYEKAIVTTRAGADAVEVVMQYKVITRLQATLMTGHAGASMGRTLRVLWTLGYFDSLVTEDAPSIYCAGPAMRAKFGMRKEEWRLPEVLRLVAANQLAAQLRSRGVVFDYDVSADASATAYLTLNDRRYAVLAPRLYPNEEGWCHQAVYTFDNDARTIVVAATEEQAASIGEYLFDVGPQVRFTWDVALRDGARFYKHTEKEFVLEKSY